MVFSFWFAMPPGTHLAIQLPQERIQVVRSNRVAWKRQAESNGTPAMDLGFEDIRKTQIYKQKRNKQNTLNRKKPPHHFFVFFVHEIQTACAPSTSGTLTDGGTVMRWP